MKRIIIASAAFLALAAPLAASAETFTNGTSTMTGTQSVKGCLTTNSYDKTTTDGIQISLQGSLQSVKSITVDGSLMKAGLVGAGAATSQIDGSLSINAAVFHDVSHSDQHFNGLQTSSSATASSSAFTSISPN